MNNVKHKTNGIFSANANPRVPMSKEYFINKSSSLEFATLFTQTYIDAANLPIGLREIACSKVQLPYIFQDILDDDLIAGHRKYGLVGFSPEADNSVGYFCNKNLIFDEMKKLSPQSVEYSEWKSILKFWDAESTNTKIRNAFPEEVQNKLPSDKFLDDEYAAFPLYRMAGINLNNKKLVELGISGLRDEVKSHKQKVNVDIKSTELYNGMIASLDLFSDFTLLYASVITDKIFQTKDKERVEELQQMADALFFISEKKPETLLQATQLVWLYNMVAGTINFGRMDIYFSEIYVKEIDSDNLTEEEALKIMQSLWRMFPKNINQFNGRVIIGGADRPNIKNADRFALLAIEATRTVKDINPQLSLRCYEGMNQKVYDLAINAVGEGCTFPMLYNDEVNILAVEKSFVVPFVDAQSYVPYGCGEFVLEYKSFGTPNAILNVLKCVELALNNGVSMLTGNKIGAKTGEFENFNSYGDFYNAYKKQVEYIVPACAIAQDVEFKIAGEVADFPYLSMLYDGCLEKGKGIFSGGIEYLGATVETYGNTNAADSLASIKKNIFEDKQISKSDLLKMLQVNFNGYEKERSLLIDAPKYGNDNFYVDEIATDVHNHLCNCIRDQKDTTNLHSHLVVIINNEMNTWYGKACIASADGRLSQLPLAPGNAASGGMDKNGATALLNSVAKLDPNIHAGTVQNIKFTPDMFSKHLTKFNAMLKTYFQRGGTQLMITVVNQKDLLEALVRPKDFPNLLVRVGGFSARFIELSPEVQQEIISRTAH
ncbi:MAG: pyruvate formate lyase family protein [Melioribacteraceae bacterium]